MNILITGANGLLGKEVCKQLSQNQKNKLFCLVRSNKVDLPSNATKLRGDILDHSFLSTAMENMDIVIHTAAMVSFTKKEKKKLFETNVDGTANIVNVCLEQKIKKLIYISSVAAIGRSEKALDTAKEMVVNEKYKWIDSPINSTYAKSKYLAELEVWRGHAEGLKTVIINPSIILGEGDWNKSSTQLFSYIYKENKFLTSGFINYVDVKDVSNIIILLMNSQVNGERYIISAGKISLESFFKKVAIQFNKKEPKLKLGKKAIALLWRIEAIRGFIIGSKPLISKETGISARTNIRYSNQKITKEIEYDFTSIDTSIKRVCQYLANKEINTKKL